MRKGQHVKVHRRRSRKTGKSWRAGRKEWKPQITHLWVKWKQVHHGPPEYFWKLENVSSLAEAREMAAEYNQFNNRYDYIKALAVSETKPPGEVDEYGNVNTKR